ncbi:MAG: hypothetical protein Q7S22_01645 [Candidatus Micrarchaeota archaeon]|nr:hypothetical protein [Candidatus Micrarchaeota archaeon]
MAEDKISFYDIAKLIELNKEKAELQFKLTYALANKDSISKETLLNLETLSTNVSSSLSVLLAKLQSAGVLIALPNENAINELSAQINAFSPTDIISAVKTKSGPLYELMGKRAVFVKKNYESRENIGKLLILIAKISKTNPDLSVKILAAIRSGQELTSLDQDSLNPTDKGYLGKLFHRIGILLPDYKDLEVSIPLNHRIVWIDKQSSTELILNFDKIKSLSTKIQLRNAERQVQIFDDVKEKEFTDLQHEYLKLLKEQDSLLKLFNEEETAFTH